MGSLKISFVTPLKMSFPITIRTELAKGDLRMGYFLQIEHTEQEQPKTKAWILSVAMH
jgi:ribulose bisphosphate carboxylase small subunit